MVIIVVYEPRGAYTRRIASAIAANDIPVEILTWRNFNFDIVNQLDPSATTIFFRTSAPSAVRVARRFEDAGFHVLNGSLYMQLSGHKYLANVHAQANGIGIPSLNVTLDKANHELLALYLKQFGPLVAKPIFSKDQGRFVYLLRNEGDFKRVAAIPGTSILVQSEVKFDRLVRAIVTTEGMLVEATTWDTKHESWKATVCDNPNAQKYRDVPVELIDVVEGTLRAFGGHIAYIDFFETDQGYLLSEINHSCGLMQHERISGCPIASELGSFVARQETSESGTSNADASPVQPLQHP